MGLVFLQSALADNIWIAITLALFVLVFAWAKKNLGSAALAVIFAIIVVYLTFYSFPNLVWVLVALFFLATFGENIIDKLNPWDKKDHLK